MKPSKLGYFQSLAEELRSQSSRVRQLIGDAHWGHDGRHKEVLLQALVRRHCPSTVLVSSGFVVSQNDPEILSSEQDILVVDTTTEAPLFNQGDLVIVFPHTVMAAISVKSTMSDATINSVVDGLATVRNVASECNKEPQRIWCGGFFYTLGAGYSDPSLAYSSLKRHILAGPARKPTVDHGLPHVLGPDVIASAEALCFLLDYENSEGATSAKIRGYDCQGMATAVFLSCLLEHMALGFGCRYSLFSDFLADLPVPRLEPAIFPILP
jgi:hypothetical protein